MRISVERKFEMKPERSEQVTAVMRMFGVGIERLKERNATHSCTVEVNDGDIVYITGPSGAGKSVLLREMQAAVVEEERINIDDIPPDQHKTVIDCIVTFMENAVALNGCPSSLRFAEAGGCATRIVERAASIVTDIRKAQPAGKTGIVEAMSLLSSTGLSDVFCMLNAPANLSEGQKYRYRLACALASGKKFVFADEFCSNLDRITAAVIAYNVRRFAKRNGITFFLASAHEDILADLQPDVLVVKGFTGEAEVSYKNHKSQKTNPKQITNDKKSNPKQISINQSSNFKQLYIGESDNSI